jgi:hypothetical protein
MDFFMSVFLARVGFRAMRVPPHRARRMPKAGVRKPKKTQLGEVEMYEKRRQLVATR